MNQSKQEKQPREQKPHRSLGKTVTYVLTIAILVIIAVALVGTPALSGASRRDRAVFGEYDGVEITIAPGNYFSRTYQNVANYYQSSGIDITDQVFYSVWQTAYYETVFHTALLTEAAGSGVDVSSEAVDRAIAVWPEFQVDGRFSPAEYQNMSSENRLALRNYLQELLVASQVRTDIDSTTALSESEIEFLANMASPERRFEYVQFGFDSFPDSEVVSYGETNNDRFRQIGISQITIDSSQSDAESIRQQATDRTSSFEDLARNQSKDEFSEDGGVRGLVYYWDLEFDFEDVTLVDDLFALGEGDISQVYETGNRWRIYKIDEVSVEPDFTETDVVAEVRSYLSTFERGIIEDHLRTRADLFTLAARSDGFTDAALAMDQLPQLTEYFPINYGNASYYPPVSSASNGVISSSGAYREEFLQQLFALEPGDVSDPVVLRDYVMVFRLDDVTTLSEDRLAALSQSLPAELGRAISQEMNQEIVDQDLFMDYFNETYSRAVLGQ